MSLRPSLRLALLELRRGWRRLAAAGIGIALAVASLVFLLALGLGLRATLLGEVLPLDRLEVAREATSLDLFGVRLPLGGDTLDSAAIERLQQIPGVRRVFPKMKLTVPAVASAGGWLLGSALQTELVVDGIDPAAHHVVSNASCTTNCLAPMAKVVHETVGIRHGWLTTIHAYTNDQRILDVQHSKDMRRARAAAVNIIPTSTGAAKAIGLVYPELAGKLDGAAMRVPVPDASVCDLTFVAGREGNVSELRAAFVDAAAGSLKGILKATEVPIVSSDVIGETHSTVIDLPLVSQVAPDFFRVVGWYDNENAYALRCVDLLEFMAGRDRA